LVDFPEQGRARDDLAAGIRIISYERRAVIVYRLLGEQIEVVRVFYGGRDYEGLMRGNRVG
jgi:toxin ParE1/3/4